MKHTILPFLFVVFSACIPRQALYQQSVDFIYSHATNIAYDTKAEGDSLRIFLKFADLTLFQNTPKSQVKLSYKLTTNNVKSEVIRQDTVADFFSRLKSEESYYWISFTIPVINFIPPGVVNLQLKHSTDEKDILYFKVPLSKGTLNQKFYFSGPATAIPLFRQYVNNSESFRIEGSSDNNSIQVKQYAAEFGPAIPPFSLTGKVVAPTMDIIQATEAPVDTIISLHNAGLYLIGNGADSKGLLVGENNFPFLNTAKELIEPLVYMTSAAEREKLYKASEPKKALDRFWLDIAQQDKNLAKRLIKVFYTRVEEANQFFSSHKAGWLSDRGMMYIIFGKPDIVNNRLNVEEWTYTRRQSRGTELKFNFIKKPNTFTENHYELVRRPDYEFVWYSTVEKWRKGIIQEE
ncbi:GWxTD domain-containing protein [Adhaeribacter aquaticus]|uniref:GWxTD domain-containing protein n=1 Tax=Adhaeribacter aquaticus TaxID=299567 RepID=UPI0003FC0916|nr:GWxTD domain-containing protein [Adhaeribacter aquaticus]